MYVIHMEMDLFYLSPVSPGNLSKERANEASLKDTGDSVCKYG